MEEQTLQNTPVEVVPETPLLNPEETVLRNRLAEALGCGGEAETHDTALTRLLEYARGKGATTPEDILWECRYLANRIASGGFGSDRLNHISNYLFLLNERSRLDDDLKRYEGITHGTNA